MTQNRTHHSRESLGILRVKAIRLRKAGTKIADIASLFDIRRETVSRWISAYRQGGAKNLKPKKSSGRPKKIDCSLLFPKLKKVVRRPATSFGFDSPLWTCKKIREVMKKELGLKMSHSTLWRSLRDAGLSCQKPERRAFEQDPIARKNWIDNVWPELKNRAKKQRAVILFEDESGISLNPTVGKTWSKIGKTPIVYTTGHRGSVNVISAITPSGRLYFTIPDRKINSDEFIKFLKKILREIPRKKIFMIVDKGSAHTSKKTTDFAGLFERLELIYLPSYSPEFNPDEYTWEYLKTVKMKNHTAQTKSELKRKTLGAMRSIQKKKKLVKSFCRRVYVT